MNEILPFFLKSAAEQSPILLTYIVAIFVAVIFWERAPRPSGLVLLAILVLLFATIGQTFAIACLALSTAHAPDYAHAIPRLVWMQSAIAFAGSILRAVGISILLAAVWLGRNAKTA
jgi:mannose/fructose/N-acetylgalactosamine-specific phosphotransferase system component IIC